MCSKGAFTSSRGRVASQKPRSFGVIRCQAASTVSEVEKDVADVKQAPVLPFRIGHGFDLHRLEPGLPLIIGGVNIPHDRGCEAHSDGMILSVTLPCFSSSVWTLMSIARMFRDIDPLTS